MVNSEATAAFVTIKMIASVIMQPLEICYCAFFIYYYVGWSILAGLVLWLMRLGLLKFFEAGKYEYSNKMREFRTERI